MQEFTDKEPRGASQCTICLDLVEHLPLYTVLKSPCCKNAWFHRECLQVIQVLPSILFATMEITFLFKNNGTIAYC